jgi:hypothetical protein
MMVQEVGYSALKERGIELVAVDGPSSCLDDTPTALPIRQALGRCGAVRQDHDGVRSAAAERSDRADSG